MRMRNTKIGDVFSVKISENQKKYFQYISNDLTQLNSDVIRAFNKTYSVDDSPFMADVINDEVEFYAHCVTKFGIKLGLWEKTGNISEIGNTENILFRSTKDYGRKIGDELIKVSQNWHVWHINDKDFTRVGKLSGINRKAEIGVVVNPYDVVDRIKTGKYNFFYPDFE